VSLQVIRPPSSKIACDPGLVSSSRTTQQCEGIVNGTADFLSGANGRAPLRAELASAGLIRLPSKPGSIGPAKPVRARGKPASQILSEERDER
jgi:hypothetical protein